MLKQVCCEGVSKGMSMRMLKDSTPRSAFSRISNVLLSSQKALEKLDGVEEAVVSHTSGTAELKLSAPGDDAAIQKAIEALDFEFVSIVK